MKGQSYYITERKRQEDLIEAGASCFYGDLGGNMFMGKGRKFCLMDGRNNLYHGIRREVMNYFKHNRITFWGGRRVPTHILSSQISCLNHLFGIRKDKDLVLEIAREIASNEIEDMATVECDGKMSAFIAFEAVSHCDLLHEGEVNRGSNCTSIDALMIGVISGEKTLIPIEWKYTEKYGLQNKSMDNEKGEERLDRYTELLNSSEFICSSANESYKDSILFVEPFYQLMRQTLWCEQMIRHSKDEDNYAHAQRYIHIHAVPTENHSLLRRPYKGFEGMGMEQVWKSNLTDAGKERYKLVDPEEIYAKIAASGRYSDLTNYLSQRYGYKQTL